MLDQLSYAGSAIEVEIEGENLASGVRNQSQRTQPVSLGAVFTKPDVANFLLDLVGYTSDRPLTRFRLLEPSFGTGAILLPAVERLLTVAKAHGGRLDVNTLAPAIRAVELDSTRFEAGRASLGAMLVANGVAQSDARALLDVWLLKDDFLRARLEPDLTHVVGNPPYVNLRSCDEHSRRAYKDGFKSYHGQGDLCGLFFEKAVKCLGPEGHLCFLATKTFMKNDSGQKLRELISKSCRLSAFVDFEGADVFTQRVSAYPGVFLLENLPSGPRSHSTRVAKLSSIDGVTLPELARALRSRSNASEATVHTVPAAIGGAEPWLLQHPEVLELARRLEALFPPLEQAGCKVGIGAATGADKTFIADYAAMNVEPCRKLPLAQARDIAGGVLNWRGKGVINTFGDDGTPVALEAFPRLQAYLNRYHDDLCKRSYVKDRSDHWHRTKDRIDAGLVTQPKILVQDASKDGRFALDPGEFYPHHNLYYITSQDWDLRALQTVLRSGIAPFFVGLYGTTANGGCFRFQAQYLRRIRLPRWDDIVDADRERLIQGAENPEHKEITACVARIYGLSPEEMALIAAR